MLPCQTTECPTPICSPESRLLAVIYTPEVNLSSFLPDDKGIKDEVSPRAKPTDSQSDMQHLSQPKHPNCLHKNSGSISVFVLGCIENARLTEKGGLQCRCLSLSRVCRRNGPPRVAHSSSFKVLICFLRNSKDEKKTALTAQERPIDTPKPRYMCSLKNSIFTGGTVWPREYIKQLRWYILLAESIGSAELCQREYIGGAVVVSHSQIMAHETIPHKPPATRTATGFDGVPSPPKFVKSCLLLS